MTKQPAPILLKDYEPAPYVTTHVDMHVSLAPEDTRISSSMKFSSRSNRSRALILDGEGLILHGITIDGKKLDATDYSYADNKLTILHPPESDFRLDIEQSCNPKANAALSGLYLSNGVYCTQMEAEGFRRFAFSQDRPDVMATYRVKLEADISVPILLSNGNPVETGRITGSNRHYAIWDDPHPKPTYLFALVGGDLASIHDTFTTSTGRKVDLGIYVEKGKQTQCAWAMECLKASMRWDEERYGRAYDLDVFNIVAVSDFNMGAMENKGLNIFNDKYILASPDSATDTDYVNIERVIAHEYFHNWTGDRITCRDWFQLCLKEGLTVFRDQEFTSDVRSRDVKRIEDVKTLRSRQFPEDQGPLSHPVRPSSYIEINNFYTATIYEKGAELCRMLHTLIGPQAFRRAMDIYFERHDGEAATVEDFLTCMSDASGRKLDQFSRWYGQSGTPIVRITSKYASHKKTLAVTITQHTPPTPGQKRKLPLHMPLRFGLMDKSGEEIAARTKEKMAQEGIIELRKAKQTFTFEGLAQAPHLSINRGFSAPVVIKESVDDADLLFRMRCDNDSFNRWEASQKLAMGILAALAKSGGRISTRRLKAFAAALSATLSDNDLDQAFKGLMLTLPSEAEVTAAIGRNVNARRVHDGRNAVRKALGQSLLPQLVAIIGNTEEAGPYVPDTSGTARRMLRYAALSLIAAADGPAAARIARRELKHPHSMTAEMGSLSAMLLSGLDDIEPALARFHERHKSENLLIDKWFAMHGAWPRADGAHHVRNLLAHPDFKLTTPNRVYALVGSFAGSNLAAFHAHDGEGYRLLGDITIALDRINPQVAARMATSFRSWRLYDRGSRTQAQREMRRIMAVSPLSRDVYEIISRTLGKT